MNILVLCPHFAPDVAPTGEVMSRIVAELALVDELPQEEIADALGISRSAVKSRAARAMKALKKALQQEGF